MKPAIAWLLFSAVACGRYDGVQLQRVAIDKPPPLIAGGTTSNLVVPSSCPVYAPGGDTYLVEDFCVVDLHHWLTTGEALLSHATTLIHEAGAAQIVVVCGDRDLAKAEILRRSDLTIASNWWTKPLN